MKTIFSLLIFPILVLAQHDQHQNAPPNMELQLNFTMESTYGEEMDSQGQINATVELFITLEVQVWEIEINNGISQPFYEEPVINFLPKHLNTLSLVGIMPMTIDNRKPQEDLKRLLALNDPMFPKEDTLFDWLHPTRYQKYKLTGTEIIPQGFGPRISI
ncbi:hypothetical protein PP182_04415 [Maribacter sp. PR1]|uniref:GLPGLI family protein n=1 Tax=Maribacter cobaltidurans TaxID=1178778 RepID=A0ABU7IR10_9FLAO|nr:MULTISPECIES: hypothetical protein [Maribacter]MDC6387909.1 hypothetical protein [Maribacter sp. PR1]MEE1975298.1 hypothetical protein [Maribacter cobaltidurans]